MRARFLVMPIAFAGLAWCGSFPPNFIFGFAVAGQQAEGALLGSDWQVFSSDPTIHDRVACSTGLVGEPYDLRPPGEAVNHFNLDTLRADLDRMKLLGATGYRFSIEWARLQPRKPAYDGDFDPAGVAYYRAVIDEIRTRGMTPFVTLNHLALPAWVLMPPRFIANPLCPPYFLSVNDPGYSASQRGWETDQTVNAWLSFVRFVVTEFRGSVKYWITLNEPVGFVVGGGYIGGISPPGFVLDRDRARAAYFNLIKAHIRAYDLIKSLQPDSQVGIAHALLWPKTTTQFTWDPFGDNLAATNQFDYLYNRHILESIIGGRIDTDIYRRAPKYMTPAEMYGFLGVPGGDAWHPRLDFIGVNYYRSVYVYHNAILAVAVPFAGGAFTDDLRREKEKNGLLNDRGWEIYPDGLHDWLVRLSRDYHLPLIVTENGMAETVDRNRAAYTVAHLDAVRRAIADGADVRGYLAWTAVDNWEWDQHYRDSSRFGYFTVDRSKRDAQGQFPRYLNESALAFQYLAAGGSMAEAVQRFGSISGDGRTMQPPTLSPGALWKTDSAAPEEMSLYISRVPSGGRWIGMAWYPALARWVALDAISWNEFTRELRFHHPAAGSLSARSFNAVVSGGRLDVSADAGSARSFRLVRDIITGNWAANDGKSWLALRNYESRAPGSDAKALLAGAGLSWGSLNATRVGPRNAYVTQTILGLPVGTTRFDTNVAADGISADYGGRPYRWLSDESPQSWLPSSPVGPIDAITDTGVVKGWALDRDAPGTSIAVHIYVNGPAGTGTIACITTADRPRPDVNAIVGVPGNHGYECQLPASLADGRTHTVYAYGIDVSGDANALLSGSPKTLSISSGHHVALTVTSIARTAVTETILVTARDVSTGALLAGNITRNGSVVGRTGAAMEIATGISTCGLPGVRVSNCAVIPLPKTLYSVLVPGYDAADFTH